MAGAESESADEGFAGLRRRFGIRLRGRSRPAAGDAEQIQFGRLAPRPTPSSAVAPPVEAAAPPPVEAAIDLSAAASACARVACAADVAQLEAALEDVAQLLAARGVIVWNWDPDVARLRAVAACRYSPQLLAQIPAVPRDANNATAAAFRSGDLCVVPAGDSSTGAVVAPVLSAAGTVGVLAIEMPAGREHHEAVQALTTMFAAPLAMFLYSAGAVAAHKRAV